MERDSFRRGGDRQDDNEIGWTMKVSTEITKAGRLPACSRP
jgi:hypothetical protein